MQVILEILKLLLPLLLALFGLTAATGCNLFDAHVKEFDLMRGMAADAALRLEDGSIGQMQVSGQALNPGVTVEACIKYTATARYDGLAGQFGVSAQGELGRAVDPQEILKIIRESATLDEARQRLLTTIAERVTGAAPDKPASP